MYEGERVNQLYGRCRCVEQLGGHRQALAGRVYEHRPDALAAVQEGIAHRLVQAPWCLRNGRHRTIKTVVYAAQIVSLPFRK